MLELIVLRGQVSPFSLNPQLIRHYPVVAGAAEDLPSHRGVASPPRRRSRVPRQRVVRRGRVRGCTAPGTAFGTAPSRTSFCGPGSSTTSATTIMRKSTGRLTPASEAGRLWASARWAYGFWSGTSEDAWQDSAIERVRPGRLFAFASIW